MQAARLRRASRLRPRPEGDWAAVLATLTFVAFLLWAGLVGVGVWRFVEESRDRTDKLSDLRTLTEDVEMLIAVVQNITIPPNCTVDVSNFTQPNMYPDDDFLIFGGADPTQEMQFNATGISTATTRILTIQNVSGIVAYLSDVIGASSVFQDDTFAVQNVADNTKEMMLDCSGIATSSIRTMTIQDASGTIAYLADLPTYPTTFLDDVFTVINAADNSKEVMLNCSQIASGAVRVMTVQDADGTIAYLGDLGNATAPPFPDDEFTVFYAAAPAAHTMLDVSGVSVNTTIVMTVQDRDGTIAYLSDILQMVEVFVNSSRVFPDVSNEGVSTLAGLGDLTHIEISMCGAGGAGAETTDEGNGGAGGGGSGFQDFTILTPDDKFDSFNVTLGAGGDASVHSGPSGCLTEAGNDSFVQGISSTGFFLELVGYGGGGGIAPHTPQCVPVRRFGGAGAGGGGSPNQTITAGGIMPGIAGTLGGVRGGVGGTLSAPTRGPFKFPWRSGGGGGSGSEAGEGPGADWQGGFAAITVDGPTGAASMFGAGSNQSASAVAAPCSGGGTGVFMMDGGDGGDGAALFRYYTQ